MLQFGIKDGTSFQRKWLKRRGAGSRVTFACIGVYQCERMHLCMSLKGARATLLRGVPRRRLLALAPPSQIYYRSTAVCPSLVLYVHTYIRETSQTVRNFRDSHFSSPLLLPTLNRNYRHFIFVYDSTACRRMISYMYVCM